MGSKRPLKHRICFITSSKEIKKMKNPRRLCSVNRKPIHCAGWAQLRGGVGRKGKGSGSPACTFPSHPWWGMRLSSAAVQTRSTQCTLVWRKQLLQSALILPGSTDMKGWSTTFCMSRTSNQNNPQLIRRLQSELTVLTGMTLLTFQAFFAAVSKHLLLSS